MKIARKGTMRLPYPPLQYGGTQRSMAQMTIFQAALHAHDITLYGPSGSTIIHYGAEVFEKLQLTYAIDEQENGRTHFRIFDSKLYCLRYQLHQSLFLNFQLLLTRVFYG